MKFLASMVCLLWVSSLIGCDLQTLGESRLPGQDRERRAMASCAPTGWSCAEIRDCAEPYGADQKSIESNCKSKGCDAAKKAFEAITTCTAQSCAVPCGTGLLFGLGMDGCHECSLTSCADQHKVCDNTTCPEECSDEEEQPQPAGPEEQPPEQTPQPAEEEQPQSTSQCAVDDGSLCHRESGDGRPNCCTGYTCTKTTVDPGDYECEPEPCGKGLYCGRNPLQGATKCRQNNDFQPYAYCCPKGEEIIGGKCATPQSPPPQCVKDDGSLCHRKDGDGRPYCCTGYTCTKATLAPGDYECEPEQPDDPEPPDDELPICGRGLYCNYNPNLNGATKCLQGNDNPNPVYCCASEWVLNDAGDKCIELTNHH